MSIGTNYHGGAYVVNYPWDSTENKESQYTEDNDIFVAISKYVSLMKESKNHC